MDPQATWNALLSAWTEGDWQEVFDLAEALLDWLANGGFSPEVNAGRRMGADWNRAVAIAACEFSLGRADEVLSDPQSIPRSVPFSLTCASCNNEGPSSLETAVAASWRGVIYTPAGLSENFLGHCPDCQKREPETDSAE